jgi:hypothetical protein
MTMHKPFISALMFFCFLSSFVSAQEDADDGRRLPADLIYLVADLKFNHDQGIQICEIQQGRASRFTGIDFIFQDTGVIAKQLAIVFKAYHETGWFLLSDIRDPHTRDALREIGWKGVEDVEELVNDPGFRSIAEKPLNHAASISDFGGVLFVRQTSLKAIDQFKNAYPSILIIDEATFGYSGDKLKCNNLFKDDSIRGYKPKWRLYNKSYHSGLAAQIVEDLRTDLVVIKPRHAAKGYGVIICSAEHLDKTLEYILTESDFLEEDPDPSYRYCLYDKSGSFIVEAYVPSDPTSVAHLEDRFFDPTMRVVYVIAHTDGATYLHFLGSYWKLPSASLDEEGSLNDLHKSCGQIPFFAEVDPILNEAVQEQVRDCYYKLYHVLRDNQPCIIL